MNYIKFATIFTILLCCLNGFSQSYLNETSKWYTIYGDTFGKYYFLEKNQIIGDTIVNDTSYLKVQISTDHLNINTITGDTTTYYTNVKHTRLLREDNRKFFTRSNNLDKLLFDFNLSLGDTVIVNTFPIEVIQIDSFIVDNETRKIFNLGLGVKIYEGIGTNQGIFHEISFPVGEYFAKLKCYFYNDIQYNINDSQIFWDIDIPPCDSLEFEEIISKNQSLHNSRFLNLYPNPFSNELVLKITSQNMDEGFLVIRNMNGKIVVNTQISFQGEESKLNLSELINGVYFLQLKVNDKIYIKKILKY